MAVTKSKAYHTESGIRNAVVYVVDENKSCITLDAYEPGHKGTFSVDDIENDPELLLSNIVDYSVNPGKTSLHSMDEQLVSGIYCSTDTAVAVFKRTADAYHRNGHNENVGRVYHAPVLLRAKVDDVGNIVYDKDGKMIHDPKAPVYHDENGDTITIKEARVNRARTCYMWVMSFPPKEVCGFDIDPRLVHHIGKEFVSEMEKVTGLKFPAVVATHVDKQHVHNHIVHSAFALDGHHKYVDTMETLRKAREVSDMLSQRYGLPVIMEPSKRSLSHDEWKLIQEGKSWKESIREEIRYQVRHAASYQDFIRCMERSGYTVRQTENHLTFVTPDKKHRARDTSLGTDFLKSEIEKAFPEHIERQVPENEPERFDVDDIYIPRAKPIRIYVSRYTETGRRRSDLEMIILKAIRIIKALMNRYSDKAPGRNPISWNAEAKLEKLQESLDILRTRGIESPEQLKAEKRAAGAQLSRSRAVVKDLSVSESALENLLTMLEGASDYRDMAERFGVETPRPDNFTDNEIAERRAELFPMTAKLRRDLYLALKEHPEYRITRKYDSITYHEAKSIVDFLSGKPAVPPDVLVTADEYTKRSERMKYSQMRENKINDCRRWHADKPASDEFKQHISDTYGIDASHMSRYDEIRYKAYMEPGFTPHVPERPEERASNKQVQLVKDLLQISGADLSVPVDKLSARDADYLINNLLLSGAEPECIRDIAQEQYLSSLAGLSYEERGYMLEYRELVNELAALGYDMSHIDEAIDAVEAQLGTLEAARADEKHWNSEYRTLSQLEGMISMAQNPHFTKGPNFDLLEPDIEEKVVDDDRQMPEDERDRDDDRDERTYFSRDTDFFDI